MPRLNSKRSKAVVSGILASLGLLLFYFLVMFLTTKSWEFPLRQFWELKFLMGPLVAGFGIQAGLFYYLRLGGKDDLRVKIGAGAGGGISGVSMVACCAHYLTNFLPILGLSGASLFLASYQKELLGLGILSNLTGIWLMTRNLKKNEKS